MSAKTPKRTKSHVTTKRPFRCTVDFTPELLARINEYAAENDRDRSKTIRHLVKRGLELEAAVREGGAV